MQAGCWVRRRVSACQQENKLHAGAGARLMGRWGARLRARALAHADDAVLLGVEHLADLAHGLRVGRAGREVAAQVQPPKQPAPAVVPLRRVGQAPRHQRLALQRFIPAVSARLPSAQAHGRQRLAVPQLIWAVTAVCRMRRPTGTSAGPAAPRLTCNFAMSARRCAYQTCAPFAVKPADVQHPAVACETPWLKLGSAHM